MAFNIPIPFHSHLFNSHSSHPIPKFLTYSHSHGFPVWAIPISSYSNSHSHLGLVIGLLTDVIHYLDTSVAYRRTHLLRRHFNCQ